MGATFPRRVAWVVYRVAMIRWLNRHARKAIAGAVGGTLVVIGLVLFVTPIPVGAVIVPLGVIVLASEFALARLWLIRLERKAGPFGRGLGAARRFVDRRWGKLSRKAV